MSAVIGLDAAGPFIRAADIELEALRVEVEGVIEGRTIPNGTVDVFPVAPTVVHAPPVWTDEALYVGSEKFVWSMFLRKH